MAPTQQGKMLWAFLRQIQKVFLHILRTIAAYDGVCFQFLASLCVLATIFCGSVGTGESWQLSEIQGVTKVHHKKPREIRSTMYFPLPRAIQVNHFYIQQLPGCLFARK